MSTESTTTSALEALSEEECWHLLGTSGVGRLGVVVGHQPDIFPVNYLVDDKEIVIRSAEGTKLAAALMGQLVAFEIDAFDTTTRGGWSVVLHGTAREDRTLSGVMHDEGRELQPWADGPKSRFIHIEPSTITGRRIPSREPATEQPETERPVAEQEVLP